jgi:uncharacterized protein (DUF983 family)
LLTSDGTKWPERVDGRAFRIITTLARACVACHHQYQNDHACDITFCYTLLITFFHCQPHFIISPFDTVSSMHPTTSRNVSIKEEGLNRKLN